MITTAAQKRLRIVRIKKPVRTRKIRKMEKSMGSRHAYQKYTSKCFLARYEKLKLLRSVAKAVAEIHQIEQNSVYNVEIEHLCGLFYYKLPPKIRSNGSVESPKFFSIKTPSNNF